MKQREREREREQGWEGKMGDTCCGNEKSMWDYWRAWRGLIRPDAPREELISSCLGVTGHRLDWVCPGGWTGTGPKFGMVPYLRLDWD